MNEWRRGGDETDRVILGDRAHEEERVVPPTVVLVSRPSLV